MEPRTQTARWSPGKEGWVSQSTWRGAGRRRRRRQLPLGEQEGQKEGLGGVAELKLKQSTGEVTQVRTLQERTGVGDTVVECFEKRQMLWEGMAGRSWSVLVQR